jgi:peptide chain release factor 2
VPGGVFDPDTIQDEIIALEQKTLSATFWENRENAEKTYARISLLKDTLDPWKKLLIETQEISDFYDLYKDEPELSDLEDDLSNQIIAAKKAYDDLYIKSLLSDKYDINDAFITIHSGAGGTEACDWVNMLLRMYLRWIEKKGFKALILDILEAEGGVKSVTIEVSGKNTYGYLKSESGVHRLVRISPFDSNKRRHTTFASVHVSPVIEEMGDIEIRPEDIRIDTYRASGAGGQHVNKTDSAVRLTHLESGLVVQCQNERSQHKNKAMAMKVLSSRLYEYYKEINEAEQSKHSIEKKEISWGNQIRSYVFQPYTMIKDHRTTVQSGNIQAVMDGDIDMFIEAYLQWKMK